MTALAVVVALCLAGCTDRGAQREADAKASAKFDAEMAAARKRAHRVHYKVDYLPDDAGLAEALLKQRGEDGWVLVQVVQFPKPYAVFRQHEEIQRLGREENPFERMYDPKNDADPADGPPSLVR